MISYCICAGRPKFSRILISELVAKTSVPYEILIWLNTADQDLLDLIEQLQARNVPIRVLGSTPGDIGLIGYRILFEHAKYDLVAQVEDDVICISRGIAEKVSQIFSSCPKVKMVVADVVQDRFTDGSRPPLDQYKPYEMVEGLCDGPVDGWFAVYHKSVIPSLYDAPYERYFYLGSWARGKVISLGFSGLLCNTFRVFHVSGPHYLKLFGILDEEVRRLQACGQHQMADGFANTSVSNADVKEMAQKYEEIRRSLGTF